MRLLLDEHYPQRIAEQLRKRGHDVMAVVETRELAGLADEDLLRAATVRRRVLVTQNLRHFVPMHHRLVTSGQGHAGLVFASARAYPLRTARMGLSIAALDALLSARREVECLPDQSVWL